MACRYTFTGPAGKEITLEGIPALKAYLATGGLDFLLPGFGGATAKAAGPQLSPPRFYSQLERSIASAKQDAAPAGDWKAIVSKLPGVKKEEVEWSGLNEYLTLRGKDKVTASEISEFLSLNNVKINEVIKGDTDALERNIYSDLKNFGESNGYTLEDGNLLDRWGDIVRSDMDESDAAEYIAGRVSDTDTKYNTGKLVLPGGRSYREMLITLPEKTTPEPEMMYRTGSDIRAKAATFVDGGFSADAVEAAAAFTDEGGSVKRGLELQDRLVSRGYGYTQAQKESGQVMRAILSGHQRRVNAAKADYANTNYQSSHWEEPNVLAHIRFNERTDADGKRVLFIEEIQSDWAQAGRKGGFQGKLSVEEQARVSELRDQRIALDRKWRESENPVERRALMEQANQISNQVEEIEGPVRGAVPAAPFMANTKDWVALGVKRILLLAAQGKYDKVAFVNGKQSADRYNLAKQIDYIEYEKTGDNDWFIKAIDHTGRAAVTEYKQSPAELENLVGKEVAQKIVNNEGSREAGEPANYGTLRNTQLEVGGEGMKSFYDRIVPQVASDVIKKLGGQLETVSIDVADKYESMKSARAKSGLTDNQWNNLTTAEQAALTPAEITDQPGFTVTPEMRDKLQGEGLPLFSTNRRAFGDLTPEQEAALKKGGALALKKTLRQRLADLKTTFQRSWQQGIFDQFAPLKELSQEAYMMARLSKGSDGTLEAAMLYGKPFINEDGIPDVNINDQGFAKTLSTLKGEHDRFLWWVAAQRAGVLKQQGLENLFDWGDISALVDLNQGNFADGTPRAPVYAKAFQEMTAFNDAVLKVAKESGLIDQKAVDLFKGTPYVPFYRVMEDGQIQSGKFSSGLVNQTAWKKLKGGKQQLSSDLLANVLLNWSHLFTASANNRAATASMQAASDMQIAYEVPAGTKKSVRVMVNGEAYHYVIEDPYVMEAVTALDYVSPSFFKPFSSFKRWLTVAVTASPTFKIRNLIRDSLSAIGTSDLQYNPLANVKRGFEATSKEGQTYASMLAGGGMIRFGSMVEGDRAHHARRLAEREGGVLLDKKGWQKLSSQFVSMINAYNELGDRMENVNRAALYEQLIKKGHSSAEANFMARDLMDFSMSGKWPVVRFLTQTVPFMNARLQGLYKLGRAAKQDPRRFSYVVGAVAMASIALMLAYEDDEDWKKRPDWDRDANWWFKIGDTAFRIPKPFEIGAIGTVAERTWELFTNDEMTAKRYGQRISNMIFDTFAMDPTPQIIKPLLDVYSNKAGFTGRNIESMGQQKQRPEDRVNVGTSQVARFLGQLGLPDPAQLAKGEYKALSPVQIDYLIRGYFGWLGTSATTIVDYGIRPMLDAGERPDMRLKDVFLLGSFVESLPSGSSRYVDQMYEQANQIDQAYASWREALKMGDTAKAKEIFEEEREKIVRYKVAGKVTDRVSELNRRIKQIQVSKSLTGETKRKMIDQLEQQKDQIARGLQPISR